jgi:hypothetical protein
MSDLYTHSSVRDLTRRVIPFHATSTVCVVFFLSTNTILQLQNNPKKAAAMAFAKLKALLRGHLSFISVHCKSADRVSLPLLYCVQHAKRLSDIYIIGCSLLAFAILAGFGNIPVIDAFFFAVSGNTESGLNTIDVKELKLGQQLVIYIFPIITNLAVVNIGVVVVRLRYFDERLRKIDPRLLANRRPWKPNREDVENKIELQDDLPRGAPPTTASVTGLPEQSKQLVFTTSNLGQTDHIAWANDVGRGNALHVPSPLEQDQGTTSHHHGP